ncbi:NAD(P)-binding protein [Punctularia strigosozonata HHB-11173 SS5]|uniref:NAD(P)-binding protein n=1 Tax=Punctularia strigosozonata (strain HHB-11173) TaxID=741275 RepID=UPI000441854F|nr:NAD(P)-binding protein [Punctularia strigosozonata HHB-11173 SS5]EIN12951.1 NAD(P)-binding protein [Punctularia strigosozonata HHB-11173 SS5]
MLARVWFITGTSSGLGRALTEHALACGDIVVATLRKPEALADLSSRYGSEALLVLRLDVTKMDELQAAFGRARETFGRLDVVVSNAGYCVLSEVEGTPLDVARSLFEVNFWGAVNTTREAVKFFREVNNPPGGRLVHISSMTGVNPSPSASYYSASKHAGEGLMEAMSGELNPAWNIKVTIITLGAFETRVMKESLVRVPQHPAYAYEGSFTSMARQWTETVTLPGDITKAARAIHQISGDDDVPLRVALGEDAIEAVLTKSARLKEEVERSKHYSSDLKADTSL